MRSIESSSPHLRRWLLGFRLVAFAGQLVTILTLVLWFQVSLELYSILALLALIPLTDLLFRYVLRGSTLAVVLLFDTLLLTGLLALSGGAANPFTVVYLIYVVLAAVLLGAKWAWIMAGVTTLNFAVLFFVKAGPEHAMHHGMMHGDASQPLSLHLYGMLGAYVVVAMLVAYFLSRIMKALKERDEMLLHFEADRKQLAAITAWAAQAAHELGSPLSTIRVVVNDLLEEIRNQKSVPDAVLTEELGLLDSETVRCKDIIDQLCQRAGSMRGESLEWATLTQIRDEALRGVSSEVTFLYSDCLDREFLVPVRALSASLNALVQNAVDVHREIQESRPVEVFIGYERDQLTVQVCDYGPGLGTAGGEKCFEPFFTTKQHGMGLGLFIARLVCQSLEGSLTFQHRGESGHFVIMSIPTVKSREVSIAA